MIKKKTLVPYILLGILIILNDFQAGVAYFTVLPIQYYLFVEAMKKRHLILTMFMFFCLMGIGLGSVTFFLNRENITGVGSNTVKDFDFSLLQFFTIYSYVFLFISAIFYFTYRRNKDYTYRHAVNFIKSETERLSTGAQSFSIYPLLCVSVLFMLVSVWMYNNNVGLIGVLQKPLPYHLSGILYYVRKLVFPCIVLYTFLRTRDKKTAMYILILYAFIVGVTGSSKSLNLMILVPASAYYFLFGYKKQAVIAAISALSIYAYVTCARVLIFSSDATASLGEVFNSANDIFITLFDDFSTLVDVVATFSDSLFGWKDIIVAYQYQNLGLSDMIRFFLGTPITTIIPDMVWELYEYELPEDKGFGIGIGFNATMIMLSGRNYLILLLQAYIISFFFSLENKCLSGILSDNQGRIYKYIMLLLIAASLITLISAATMVEYYLVNFVIFVLYRFRTSKAKKRIVSI